MQLLVKIHSQSIIATKKIATLVLAVLRYCSFKKQTYFKPNHPIFILDFCFKKYPKQ